MIIMFFCFFWRAFFLKKHFRRKPPGCARPTNAEVFPKFFSKHLSSSCLTVILFANRALPPTALRPTSCVLPIPRRPLFLLHNQSPQFFKKEICSTSSPLHPTPLATNQKRDEENASSSIATTATAAAAAK
jgi:hypothetical protein